MSRTSTTFEHPIGAEGLFVLQIGSGDVRLHGVDGETVRIEDRHGSVLPDAFDIEAGDGSLAVRARKGFQFKTGPGRHTTPDLDVRVPRRATVVVEASSSDLTAEDLSGEQQFRTASGDIDLARVSGTVAIEAASGDVALMATGELRLRARTVSGDLEVRAGRLAEVSAATTSGDLAIAGELAPDGTHKIETVSGDTILALAGGVRIEVSTVTGDVSADVPHRSERADGRRVVVVGDGRARLVASTMSGDIHIVKARPHDVPVEPVPALAPPSAPPAPEPAPSDPPALPTRPSPLLTTRPACGSCAVSSAARSTWPKPAAGSRRSTPRGSARTRPVSDALERVLQLVAEGRLTAEEAAPLLDALEAAQAPPPSAPAAPGEPGSLSDDTPRVRGPHRGLRRRSQGRQPAYPARPGAERVGWRPRAVRGGHPADPRGDQRRRQGTRVRRRGRKGRRRPRGDRVARWMR